MRSGSHVFCDHYRRNTPNFARSYDKELATTKLNDVYGHLRSEFNNRPLPSIKESAPPAPASTNYAFSSSFAKKLKKRNKGKGSPLRLLSLRRPKPTDVVIATKQTTQKTTVMH
jgi:hypothetical protein